MFMTPDELYELTGYRLQNAQCRWLDGHGYPYDKSASGKPKVLRTYLIQRLGFQSTQQNTNEPDFSALD